MFINSFMNDPFCGLPSHPLRGMTNK